MPPRERRKNLQAVEEEADDRISGLPESIILHILSLLPTTKDAIVSTATLSKRWQFLWTSVPVLSFRQQGVWRDDLKFIALVDQTLILYGCSNVRKFHLDSYYKKNPYEFKVNTWLHFATRHHVEELFLHLAPYSSEIYRLPQFLFENDSIKTLSLRYCDIVPKGVINWRLLGSLWISYARLSDPLIEKNLSGCPVLECLELCDCSGISRLDVKSSQLRKLVIDGHERIYPGSDDPVSLEISGPNLTTLRIVGDFYGKKCVVRNVSSLVDATFSFLLHTDDGGQLHENAFEEYWNILREILENLHHVKKLTVGNWCLHVLSICKFKELPSPSCKYEYLAVDTGFNFWDLPGIASLLHSSPGLQTLFVNMTPPNYSEFLSNFSIFDDLDGVKYWTSQTIDSLLNLKTVKIVGFGAELNRIVTNNVLDFIEFMLRNASVLEKMVIYRKHHILPHQPCADSAVIHDVCHRLLSFPRSSPNARIILKNK